MKGRTKLSCHHERQIKEDKTAEQKSKPYQWLFYVRIKFIWYFVLKTLQVAAT